MAAAGPFENNGMTPASLAVGKVAQIEAARAVLRYLEEHGLGLGIEWDDMAPLQREALVDALGSVLTSAGRTAAKAAVAELALYEERALTVPCPRCQAETGEECRDMRMKYETVRVRHPHQPRLDAVEPG